MIQAPELSMLEKIPAWNTPLQDPNLFNMPVAVNNQLDALEVQILAIPPMHAASDMFQLGLLLVAFLTWKPVPMIEVNLHFSAAGITPAHRLIASIQNRMMTTAETNYYLFLMICDTGPLFPIPHDVWVPPVVPLPAIATTPAIQTLLHYDPRNRPDLATILTEFANW